MRSFPSLTRRLSTARQGLETAIGLPKNFDRCASSNPRRRHHAERSEFVTPPSPFHQHLQTNANRRMRRCRASGADIDGASRTARRRGYVHRNDDEHGTGRRQTADTDLGMVRKPAPAPMSSQHWWTKQKQPKPLAPLPTVGYVWPTGSPVGYSVKYAHRTPAPTAASALPLVMDKRIGSYDYRRVVRRAARAPSRCAYSVLELSHRQLWQRRGNAIARGRRRCRRGSGHRVPRYGRDDGQRPKGRQTRIGGPVTAGPRNSTDRKPATPLPR